MKERKGDPGRVGPTDFHEIALRPIGGGKARARGVLGVSQAEGLDLVDYSFQNVAIPPRG